MEQDLQQRLDAQDALLAKIYISTEKTRKYFLTTMIITVVTIVLPLIGLVFVIPYVLSTYQSAFAGLL